MSNKPPPPLPELKVYVAHEGKTWGPYDTATLQRHVDDRKFLPTDQANIAGASNWQPLNTIALFPVEKQEVHIHHKEKKKTGCITWGVLGVFIIGFIGAIGDCGGNHSKDRSATQTEVVKDEPLTDDEIKGANYVLN